MNDTFNKETVSFYMVALASALAGVAAMCTTVFWRTTGGIAVGFALLLPAVLLACFGFAYPSPLNKVRCAFMLGNTFALGTLFGVLFIITDLAGAKASFYTVAGVFRPNAVGVLLTVYGSLGLLVTVLTTVRVAMQAFGKSMSDLERRLAVQSAAPTQEVAPTDVEPRKIDEQQVIAKADQEVRMNRLNVVPTGAERPVVSPQEARAIAEARRAEEQREPEPIMPEPEAAPSAEEPRVVRSILDAEPAPIAPQPEPEPEIEVIYADNDEVDDEPTVEVEMAHGDNVSNDDIRSETAVHRPRQKEAPSNDDLYTDFSYAGDNESDDDDRR